MRKEAKQDRIDAGDTRLSAVAKDTFSKMNLFSLAVSFYVVNFRQLCHIGQ
jgi:hypothetical protein